jgi:hypothetical protein
MYSYFFGAARYDANMTTKFNTYGGPEESHLAYKGIDSLTLKADRRYNELTYEGEIDHFNQPHYELINEWRPTDKIQLGNTFYYFSGDGYYDQNRRRQDYEEFFPGVFEIKTTDSTLAPHNYYARDDSDHIEIDSLGQFTLTKVDISSADECRKATGAGFLGSQSSTTGETYLWEAKFEFTRPITPALSDGPTITPHRFLMCAIMITE